MRPEVGVSNPAIMRSVVVLPEPDGPSIEKNSPWRTSRSTPATAMIGDTPPPNSLRTPSSRIAGPNDAVERGGSARGGSDGRLCVSIGSAKQGPSKRWYPVDDRREVGR